MPNLLQETLAADSSQILEEIGHTVIWKGAEYRALVADPLVSVDLDEGGFMPQGDFQIKIKRTDFSGGAGPFPAINDRIEFSEETYKIIAERNKADSAFVILSIQA